jgi:hypothetical protein
LIGALIQRHRHYARAALPGLAPVEFIREKMHQRAQEKGTKTTALAVSPLQGVVFEQMQQEFLREVLRLGLGVAAQLNEVMKRRPITATQFLQRGPRLGLALQSGLGEQAPVRRGKIHFRIVAWR